jgi:hypothetical protein
VTWKHDIFKQISLVGADGTRDLSVSLKLAECP